MAWSNWYGKEHQNPSPATSGSKVLSYFVDKQHKIIPELGSAYGIEREKERFALDLHEVTAGWLLQCEGQYVLRCFPVE